MGITAARPYIIDEFESDDEAAYEPAVEYVDDRLLLNSGSPMNRRRDSYLSTKEQRQIEEPFVERQVQEVQASNSNAFSNLKGLEELLKLLENHDFEGAQKAASLLKMSPAMYQSNSADDGDEGGTQATLSQSVKSIPSSTITSTWSTNTEEDLTEMASGSFPMTTEPAEDLTEEQRKVLAQLDEELNQFEANEEKIASEPHIFHSAIPRPVSSTRSSGGNTGVLTDTSRKTPDRKRSPSPSGRLKASGIPRYAWAHVSPVTGSPSSPAESKMEHALDANCLSDTLQSLPELSDRIQANRKTWDKTFVVDKHCSNSTGRSESSLTSGPSGDTPQVDTNLCDHTGRVRIKKRHFCLPASWTKPEEFPKIPSKTKCNLIISNSSSSQMNTEEILACRDIGECGDPSERKVFDLKRWLRPVTQETAMKLFGFTSPFDEICFGPITGNLTLLRWFSELCSHFNVNGQGRILYKPSGTNQTDGMTDDMALDILKKGLKDTNTAFIYHCHNHYFCPIGYEETPQFCVDAYSGDVGNNTECWVLVGDTSRKYPSIHCFSWDQISQDLHCKNPSYMNIRHSWKGVMQQMSLRTCGENLHCILAFQTVPDDLLSSSSSACSKTKSCLQPNSHSSMVTTTVNSHLNVNAHRPELGDVFNADYQEEEVGSEKLDSDKSDDEHVDESECEIKESETVKCDQVLVKESETLQCDQVLVKESETVQCDQVLVMESETVQCDQVLVMESETVKCDQVLVKESEIVQCDQVLVKEDETLQCDQVLVKEDETLQCDQVLVKEDETLQCDQVLVKEDETLQCDQVLVKEGDTIQYDQVLVKESEIVQCAQALVKEGETVQCDQVLVKEGETVQCDQVLVTEGDTVKCDQVFVTESEIVQCDQVLVSEGETVQCDQVLVFEGETMQCDQVLGSEGETMQCGQVLVKESETVQCDQVLMKESDTVKCDQVLVTEGDTVQCDQVLVSEGETVQCDQVLGSEGETVQCDQVLVKEGEIVQCDQVLMKESDTVKCDQVLVTEGDTVQCDQVLVSEGETMQCDQVLGSEGETVQCDQVLVSEGETVQCGQVLVKESDTVQCDQVLVNVSETVQCSQVLVTE